MRLLKELSTFKIGGMAKSFAEAKTVEEMQSLLREAYAEAMPVLILGKGSNCLFADRGFEGLVILNKIDFITPNGSEVHVGAGFSFALLGIRTAKASLTGLEFASGIPGSVGGAVFMNAGANGQETKDCLISVDFVDEAGRLERLSCDELTFSYRKSPFHFMKGAIVGATFQLKEDAGARERQLKIVQYRQETQPYHEPSIGCIFRNPQGECCLSAGALIEQAGLKGVTVGGARVSQKHANFIVNPTAAATAADVEGLIAHIKETVMTRFGIMLEEEIRKIGFKS